MRDVKYKTVFEEFKAGKRFLSDSWGSVKGGFQSPPSYSHAFKIGHIQFAGLLDKNGKDIYEGFIVDITNSKSTIQKKRLRGVVGFSYCSFMVEKLLTIEWEGYNKGIYPPEIIYLNSILQEQIEIIGNIYENENLLL